jgi:hypothetical protein
LNTVLKRIFGPKRDGVIGGWRKLHKELRDFYSLPRIIGMMMSWKMRWAEHVARMWHKRKAYSLLVGKPEGTKPLVRPRLRWVGNLKTDLIKVRWGGVEWIGLAQDRDSGGPCACGNELSVSIMLGNY